MGGDTANDREDHRAFVLVAAATLLTVLSVGLALAGAVPAVVPAYVSVLQSGLVLALNAAAIWLADRRKVRTDVQRLTLCGLALIGPIWTACVWNSGWTTFVWVTTLVMGGGAAGIAWSLRRQPAAQSPELAEPRPVSASTTDIADSAPAPSTAGPRLADGHESSRNGWLLRLERRTDDDREVVEIEWRIDFAAGELQRSLHLPIAPPLASIPEVECEPLEGVEVDVMVGAALAYGVRLDVRRRGDTSRAGTAAIGVLVQAPVRVAEAA